VLRVFHEPRSHGPAGTVGSVIVCRPAGTPSTRAIPPYQLGSLVAVKLGIGGIGIEDPALGILDGNAQRQGIHDASEVGIDEPRRRRRIGPANTFEDKPEFLAQGIGATESDALPVGVKTGRRGQEDL